MNNVTKKRNIEDVYPMTPLQQGMYFHAMYHKDSSAYFMQTSYRVSGEWDLECIEFGLSELVKRHDILRTVFVHKNVKTPLQIVLQRQTSGFCFIDMRKKVTAGNSEEVVADFRKQDLERSFDLEKGPLLRLTVLRLQDSHYEFVWSNHHILMDGWCSAALIAEFMEIYECLRVGSPLRLPPPVPFKRYIQWLGAQHLADSQNHWQALLSGYEGLTGLPADWKRSPGDEENFEACEYSIELSEQCDRDMKAVTGRFHVTANTILQAAWGILLGKYNHARDVVFGAVESVRPASIKGIERMMGLFINTIPVRVECPGQMTVERLLALTQERSIAGKPYNHFPLAQIQSEFLRQPSLLDHILVFENYPVDQNIDRFLPGRATESGSTDYKIEAITLFGHTNYDFSIVAVPSRSLTLTFKYNDRVYSGAVIQLVAGHLLNVLGHMVEDPFRSIEELEILSDAEKHAILFECNDCDDGALPQMGIFTIFQQQAECFPNRIAVVYRNYSITYSSLEACSSSLASRLRGYGVGEDVIAGILAEPSLNMIVSLLGVLAAGGAFLPMDGRFPTSRVEALLSDCGAPVLLSDGINRNPSGFRGELIDISSPHCFGNQEEAVAPLTGGRQLAYVISTSGTTGKPKGVMITHGNLVNYVSWFSKTADISSNDRSALLSSYAYDLGYTSLFTTLLGGGQLHILDNDSILSPRRVLRYIELQRLSFLKMTPSLLSVLVVEPEFQRVSLARLRVLALGGEAIKPRDVALFHQHAPWVNVMNHYGPAESCIGAVAQWIDFQRFDSYMSRPTIGKPVTNVEARIFDLDKHDVPVGVAGELYLSGAGLGRGYVNAPELTAERFIQTAGNGRQRIYKTGDLARRLEDGTIEFLGRVDRQLKIRGFRVECGEIEHALKGHPGISAAVVVPRHNSKGETVLCAYFVGKSTGGGDEIRDYLHERLPDYMVPSYFCLLDEIPLTKNRKLDHDALPDPAEFGEAGIDFESPLDGTECVLAGIWRDVLGKEKISALDNFFQCGGHSLNAISLASRIHKEFKKELTLKGIFANPVLRQMARLIDGTSKSKEKVLPKAGIKDFFSASSAQRRIFMLEQMEGIGASYHMSQFFLIEGELDIERVKWAFKEILGRHGSLRTSFGIEDTILRQVHHHVPLPFDYYEEPDLHCLGELFLRPFDLSSAPLVRFGVGKLADRRFVLMVDMHHIISDGISNSIIIEEFMHYYCGEEPLLPVHSYQDFAFWQDQRLKNGELDSQREFWLDSLGGELPSLNLPADFPRPSIQSFSGATIKKKLNRPLANRLKQLAADKNASLYMILLAAYTVLLGRYSNQEDVLVGTVVAGRPHRCFNDVVGLFANTLALRYFPLNSQTISQFLEITRQTTLDAFTNQDYPFEELVGQLDLERDWGRNPLFATLFINQNMERKELQLPGLEVSPLELDNVTSKFDLSVFVMERGEDIEFHLEYCTGLFRPRTIERLWEHYTQILTCLPDQLSRRVGDLDMMTDRERGLALSEFNDTGAEFPADATIDELFVEMALQQGDKQAIFHQDCQMTYRELNVRSGKIAAVLREAGGRPGNIVALLMERGIPAVIGILGILKSRQAYLPIEPSFPRKRKQLMVNDCGARVVLTVSQLMGQATTLLEAGAAKEVYLLDDENANSPQMHRGQTCGSSSDPAYVMYTSGSTGYPKGVLVEHRSVVRLVKNTNFIPFHSNDRILQTGPLAFDASTFEIWGPLLNGLIYCALPKESVLSPFELKAAILRYRITTMWMTSPLFNQHMNTDPGIFAPLHTLLVGGDALSLPHINQLVSLYPELRVVNGYGPTENTTFSTTYTIEGTHDGGIPIGKPVANSTCYVLNAMRRPQGIGVIGELCVGGYGVSRGYINDPHMTSRKYFDIPELPGERLYATGDIVRWNEEGLLDYLGRKDQQLKVRGNRVEIGEIEKHILRIGAVKNAVVSVRSQVNDNKDLIAYIVARDAESTVDSEALADRLAESLPEYMIPAYFVQIREIPLNDNGKVDYSQLPEPAQAIRESNTPPRDEWEKKLAALWIEILDLPGHELDIDDNFFRLGGHSLKATLLVARIHKEFDVKVPLVEVFRAPSIRKLSDFIHNAAAAKFEAIRPAGPKERYRLSSAQKRLYFFQQMEPSSTAYNLPQILWMIGPLDMDRLRETFQRLASRHEGLRTSFEVVDGDAAQVIHENLGLNVEYLELTSEEADESVRQFVRPFDLTQAPLMRVRVAAIGAERNILMVDMHHIVSDGLSNAILVREFMALYDGKPLPRLRLQYRDYAEWQADFLDSEDMAEQEKFWLAKFRDAEPYLDLPFDSDGRGVQEFTGENVAADIGEATACRVDELASAYGATQFVVLLAVCNILAARYTRQEDITIGVPIAGRKHADLENIIGMFVNMLPIRNHYSPDLDFGGFVSDVNRSFVEAMDNQEYQFDVLVDRLNYKRKGGRNPLSDLVFALDSIEVAPLQMERLRFEPYGYEHATSKRALRLGAFIADHSIRMTLTYATSLFKYSTAKTMMDNYLDLVRQVTENPGARLGELRIRHGLIDVDGVVRQDDGKDFDF